MKRKLEKITNSTINELLNNEIILPSLYFERFNYHAKEVEVNLDDQNFQKEINELLIQDYKNIEKYINLITSSVNELKNETKNASTAILNKDNDTLSDIYKKMITLEKEIELLNNELFIDETTKTYNRKWLYSKFLNENLYFKDNGICTLVDIIDYEYIQKEYGELLAKNFLIFVINFISQKLKDENYDFYITRYFDDKFFIFILNENQSSIVNYLLNLEQMLLNTTLKSHSGLYIKANYKFKVESFSTKDESKSVFEKLLN